MMYPAIRRAMRTGPGAALLLAAAGCGIAAAADMPVKAPPPPPVAVYNPWRIDITPYGWMPSLNGTSTVKGHSADVDASFFGDIIHGATGSAILGEMQPKPRLYKGHQQTAENLLWSYKGPPCDQYQREHDLLFDAIRHDKPYNETERCAKGCFTAILGRMACNSGKRVTWDEALASDVELAPGLENLTSLDSDPPVKPDEMGRYEIAMPGQSPVL